jgi:hypothetical protein
MYTPNELKDNDDNDSNSNNVVIIREFRTGTRIHEHDFISTKSEKELTTIICITCGSLYCGKCGKLVTIIDQNYMQNNIYN